MLELEAMPSWCWEQNPRLQACYISTSNESTSPALFFFFVVVVPFSFIPDFNAVFSNLLKPCVITNTSDYYSPRITNKPLLQRVLIVQNEKFKRFMLR